MKLLKKLSLIVLGLLQTPLLSQSDKIIIGQKDSIKSEILGETRKLWIHVPKGSDEAVFTPKKYPVVYLLDGDAYFSSMQGMVKVLSNVNGNTVLPEMIIVGIPNTNRLRDLSPSKPNLGDDPFFSAEMIAQTGGGQKFISFIEKELIPYIDSKYPTEPFRTFVGHSLGGLMVMQVFSQNPDLFSAYVAIDPSMSWHRQKLLTAIKDQKLGKKYQNKSLYLGIANSMNEGSDTTGLRKDKSPMTFHIRSILELHDFLSKQKNKLNYQGKFYPNDDHPTIPYIAQYDAFRFLFKSHQFKLKMEDYMFPTSNVAERLDEHYKQLSTFFGYEKKPSEEYVNSMGYQFINMKFYGKAEQLLQLNVKYYPKSFNVYDSLGDLYDLKGEKDKAIEYYKKALKIKPDSDYTKDKLAKIQG